MALDDLAKLGLCAVALVVTQVEDTVVGRNAVAPSVAMTGL